MNLKLTLIGLAVLAGLPAVAQETNQLRRPDYAAFQVVSQKNIFNQYRVARRRETGRSRPATTIRMGDAFSLVGTMNYEKGAFAFFDGTNAEYRRIVQPEGTIAVYKVTEITPASVILETHGQKIEMKVGTQMRRNDAGVWQLVEASEWTPPTAGSPTVSPAEPASSSSGDDANDVLKKLMQKREQELK